MPEGITKGVFFNIIGIAASAVLLLVFNITTARILGPVGYGLLNVLYSLILTVTPLLSRGIRDSVVRFISEFEAKEQKARIYSTMRNGLTATAVFLAVFWLISLIFRDSIQIRFLDGESFLFIVFILAVSSYSLVEFVISIFQGFREFKLNAVIMIVQRISMVLVLLLFVMVFGFGIRGASVSLFAAPLLTLILIAFLFPTLKGRFSRSREKIEAKEFWGFVIPATFIGFFNIFLLRSGPLVIKALGDVDANRMAGLFSGAFTLISPVRMMVMALLESLFPHLSRVEAMKDTRLVQKYIKKSTTFIVGICVLIIVGYSLLGPFVLKVVYGKDFVLQRIHFLLIASIVSFYSMALLFTKIALARGYAGKALVSWGISILALVLFILHTNFDILLRTELGLCLANLVAFVLMLTMLKAKGLSHFK